MGRLRLEQQHFHRAAAAGFAAAQPSRNDPAVVGHQHVAGLEIVADLVEQAVLDAPAVAVDNQQTGMVPRLDRRLSDELRRQLVIELGSFQAGSIATGLAFSGEREDLQFVLLAADGCRAESRQGKGGLVQ